MSGGKCPRPVFHILFTLLPSNFPLGKQRGWRELGVCNNNYGAKGSRGATPSYFHERHNNLLGTLRLGGNCGGGMRGDLGGNWGTAPQIWGGGTVHASVPPIFEEVVSVPPKYLLSQVRTEKSGNVVCEMDVFVKKRVISICVLYVTNEIYATMPDSRDRGKYWKKAGSQCRTSRM